MGAYRVKEELMEIDIDLFLWCIRQIPGKLDSLIASITGQTSQKQREAVLAFYRVLRPDEIAQYRSLIPLIPIRTRELAASVGLEIQFTDLPFRIIASFAEEAKAREVAALAGIC